MARTSVSITIEVPAELADERTHERARLLLLLDAVRSERLSWRAAARELGISPSELLDLAREHGVPVARVEVADWRDDLATVERLVPGGGDGGGGDGG